MPNQTFKKIIPLGILVNILDKYGIKKKDHYIFDYSGYRKAKYYEEINKFCELIKPFYFKSKQHYVDQTQTFRTFSNILRQIARSNNVIVKSKIKYQQSDYTIVYSFFCKKDDN